MGKISRDELERGSGSNGEPVLVAVDGKVYDVSASALWKGGGHMNTHSAGRDLSRSILDAPHGREVLARVKLVGDLEEEAARPAPARDVPAWAAAILSRHPHPVTVHFPIALSVAGAVFTAIGMAIGSEQMEIAGLLDLAFGAVAAPAAIAAGLLSWKFNYGGRRSRKFVAKMALSAAYLAIAGAAVALRLTVPAAGDGGTLAAARVAYAALVMALPVAAVCLGYLGGTITFPKIR